MGFENWASLVGINHPFNRRSLQNVEDGRLDWNGSRSTIHGRTDLFEKTKSNTKCRKRFVEHRFEREREREREREKERSDFPYSNYQPVRVSPKSFEWYRQHTPGTHNTCIVDQCVICLPLYLKPGTHRTKSTFCWKRIATENMMHMQGKEIETSTREWRINQSKQMTIKPWATCCVCVSMCVRLSV